jgi:hypothetical protein
MQLTEEQQSYLSAHPVEVALTMPPTWDDADGCLPMDEVNSFLANWLASRDSSIAEQAAKRIERDPCYMFKLLKAQELALAYVNANGLAVEGYEPKFQNRGKGVLLWHIEQGADTQDPAIAIMNQYGLSMEGCTTSFGAEAMWDLQARKQVGDYMIDLYGDDRGWGEGAYYLVITYNNAEVDRLFELDTCGV